MSIETTGLVFDVATVLGLGPANKQPLPEVIPGAIVLRVPEGISFQSLRDGDVGKQLMYPQDWYEKYTWFRSPFAAGMYSLRLPIPGSKRKTFKEQQSLLHEGETVPPVALVALALLCCRKKDLPDPLKDGWVRCKETTVGVYRVELSWEDGRLIVNCYGRDGIRDGSVWAAGAKKID